MAEPFSFLSIPSSEWVAWNELAFAIRDRYPVTEGHTLVIPRRLVATWFEATREEQHALFALVEEVKLALDHELRPNGYNVGFNAGVAAGQTVMHLHVHVIPRRTGDCDDPRGGVRGVIPSKQKYKIETQPSRAGESSARYALQPRQEATWSSLPSFVHGEDSHFVRALRCALEAADAADIVSAFVQPSGLNLLYDDLDSALVRGARIRFLTGDYLGVTSADALRRLLALADRHARLEPYFYETKANLAFHPKSYIFMRGERGVAYVGSSNLSQSALEHGVEWNLRLVSSEDALAFTAIRERFEHLVRSPNTTRLTRAVIEAYEARAPIPAPAMPEPRAPLPTPHEIQREALDALKKTRRDGHRKGLIVLATGLGKTLLSAFDFKAMGGERALFVAHREEILERAQESWQTVFPDKVSAMYDGSLAANADIVFASVQTLSRARHLARFAPEFFDYIVMDEFHHAAASTYRKILGHFRPRFLIGLTATPDRMDGRPLLELCDENLVYRRDLVHGVSRQLLVPFKYFGIKDTTNYEPIPWRGRFDPEELTRHVATIERAEQALREYRAHTSEQRRALAFCCTTEHADFMARYFNDHDIKAAAVHSGLSSAPRAGSLRALKEGQLEVICAVDVFNEGLDVPDINVVLMLRPTESPVIFLQQLGRGLRRAPGKSHMTVIDFIGNHRSFLTKPQTLVLLTGQELPPLVALERIQDHTLVLPEGCSIDISTEAIDLLRSLVRTSSEDIAVYEYMTFRDAHGRRPSAAELFDAGVNFAPLSKNYSTWFHFVREQGDLTPEEQAALAAHDVEAWLGDLLRTRMSKAYKMLALRALLDHDALFTGMDLEDNARHAFEAVRTDLLLNREMREDESRATFSAAFVRGWREMPLQVWARGESTSKSWFALEGDRFTPRFAVAAEHQTTFEEMTEEMVELRLAQQRDRLMRGRSLDASEAPIILTVSHSNMRPILRFDRERRSDIPEGPTFVEVEGDSYSFDFKKIAVNVATEDGGAENVLTPLLRRWFGVTAGHPGTRRTVRLVRTDTGWRLERNDHETRPPALTTDTLPYYTDVRAACGVLEPAAPSSEPAQQLAVATNRVLDPKKHFVLRASGDSMNGGVAPIEDGDLVLCEWARGLKAEEVEGKPVLLVGRGDASRSFSVLKVPRRRDGQWWLESWNPEFPAQPVPPGVKLEPVARVLEVVTERMGLTLWGEYDRDAIAKAFGSKNDPSWKVGHRDIELEGKPHTILMITLRKAGQTKVEHRYADQFLTPDSLQWESQASTKVNSAKGRRIIGHATEGRTIHLFVQYDARSPFTYFGPVTYERHESEAPMRVMFTLATPLPDPLWRLWSK